MKFEESNLERETKEMKWKAIEQSIEDIKDKKGRGIDEKIKPAVVALHANDFGTTGSCEGHSDWAYPWPWIDVGSPLAEKLLNDNRYNELKEKARAMRKGTVTMIESEQKEYTRLIKDQIEENKKEYQRIINLIKEFYKSSPEETSGNTIHLDIDKGPWNQSRIQPSDVPNEVTPKESQKMWSNIEKEGRLEIYRREIERFTEFLKQKFFENNN